MARKLARDRAARRKGKKRETRIKRRLGTRGSRRENTPGGGGGGVLSSPFIFRHDFVTASSSLSRAEGSSTPGHGTRRLGRRAESRRKALDHRTTQDAARARSTGWPGAHTARTSSPRLGRVRGRAGPHRSRTRERVPGWHSQAGRGQVLLPPVCSRCRCNLLVSSLRHKALVLTPSPFVPFFARPFFGFPPPFFFCFTRVSPLISLHIQYRARFNEIPICQFVNFACLDCPALLR